MLLKHSGETDGGGRREKSQCLQWSNYMRLSIEDLHSSLCCHVSLWYS